MLDPVTSFIVALFVLLACAVVAGEICVRFGQAALVGQLLVGVVLGPTLLGPYIGLTSLSPQLTGLQFLATIFILFMAGLEVVPEEVYRMGWQSLAMGLAVFFVPFTVGVFLVGAIEPGIGYPTNLFVALTLSITALPVMGIMLAEFGLLRARIGKLLMNIALVNELTAVSVFAVLLRLSSSGRSGTADIAVAVLSVAVFISAMLAVHLVLKMFRSTHRWAAITNRFSQSWRSKQGGFAILMVMVVGATLFSQFLGLTYVVGAFYAGLLITQESAGREAHQSISHVFDMMTWGFFIPLFFAFVGISMNLRLLATAGAVIGFVLLALLAIVPKIATGAGFAYALGWKKADAIAVGHMVNSRGAVELAMAVILLQAHLIDVTLFTLIAAVGLVTTIMAPIGAVRAWLSDPESREELFRRVPSLRPSPSPFRKVPILGWRELRSIYSFEELTEWEPPAESPALEPASASLGEREDGRSGSAPPPLPTRPKPPSV